MKATVSCLGALVVALAITSAARATDPFSYCFQRQAPDATGPGFISYNYYGAPYGPNYYVRPPWPPFNGLLPVPQNQANGGGPMFPTHPYARGPRDYFMYEGR